MKSLSDFSSSELQSCATARGLGHLGVVVSAVIFLYMLFAGFNIFLSAFAASYLGGVILLYNCEEMSLDRHWIPLTVQVFFSIPPAMFIYGIVNSQLDRVDVAVGFIPLLLGSLVTVVVSCPAMLHGVSSLHTSNGTVNWTDVNDEVKKMKKREQRAY